MMDISVIVFVRGKDRRKNIIALAEEGYDNTHNKTPMFIACGSSL